MSSIIDALKKSDKDRNHDQANSVNSIKFTDEKPKKSRKGFWLLVFILLLIAGGVFAWQQGWHHGAISKLKNMWSTPTINQTAKNNADSQPKTASKPISEKPTAQKLVPPKASDVKAKTTETKQRETVSREDKPRTQPIKDRGEKPAAKTKPDSVATTGPTSRPKPKTDEQPKTVKPVTETKPDKSLDPKLKQDHLLVHQIPFEIRKNIPPIKLNIHIYDPEPENRMVLLNGVKYAVGDLIEEVVEVKDITQEGVLLKFESVEFLVPK